MKKKVLFLSIVMAVFLIATYSYSASRGGGRGGHSGGGGYHGGGGHHVVSGHHGGGVGYHGGGAYRGGGGYRGGYSGHGYVRPYVYGGWGSYRYYPYPYPYAYDYYPYWETQPALYPPPPMDNGMPNEQPQNYWYYCQNPQGYFPHVQSCPGGWLQVVPQVNQQPQVKPLTIERIVDSKSIILNIHQ